MVGDSVVPDIVTNKTSFKHWSRRYKLVAGAPGERFNVFVGWAQAREASAPTIVPETSKVEGARGIAQHLYASPLMSTEAGMDAHSVGYNGLGAWRRFISARQPQYHE